MIRFLGNAHMNTITGSCPVPVPITRSYSSIPDSYALNPRSKGCKSDGSMNTSLLTLRRPNLS